MHAQNVRRVLTLSALALIIIVGISVVALRPRAIFQSRYYDETGHTVREPFLAYFDEHGGIDTFGFPLTDAYTDSDGVLIQTFQRARLQLTVRGVELAPIGVALRLGEPGQAYVINVAFTQFYEQHGGADFLGSPLNAAHRENDLLVQDFENARLVQRSDGKVQLANLGSAYILAFPPPDDSGRAAIRLKGTPTPPPALRIDVSVARPTVEQGGEQTIYLYVQDETGQPIKGAQGLALLRYNSARAEIEFNPTDARGFTSATFVVPPATPGVQVVVEMHVLIGEVFMSVETTYFQWW